MKKFDLILHSLHGSKGGLSVHYERAFNEAVELYIVSAYLTEWKVESPLGRGCKRFRMIVGQDFGITRKHACQSVLNWLPTNLKSDFLVADKISGFHPKAVFWRNAQRDCFALVGSSNLTRAAFEENVEANAFGPIDAKIFQRAKLWIDEIVEHSTPVSESWLAQYVEAPPQPRPPKGQTNLPIPSDARNRLHRRRKCLIAHQKVSRSLFDFFQKCGDGGISSSEFFDRLPTYWSLNVGNRLQGKGWERLGKNANFQEISQAFLAIQKAGEKDRDDEVRRQMDLMNYSKNPARKAFFTELLCLFFPEQYPLLNEPVNKFLLKHSYRAAKGASEGARYIDLARKLRNALRSHPDHPAKNLAELDTLIRANSK